MAFNTWSHVEPASRQSALFFPPPPSEHLLTLLVLYSPRPASPIAVTCRLNLFCRCACLLGKSIFCAMETQLGNGCSDCVWRVRRCCVSTRASLPESMQLDFSFRCISCFSPFTENGNISSQQRPRCCCSCCCTCNFDLGKQNWHLAPWLQMPSGTEAFKLLGHEWVLALRRGPQTRAQDIPKRHLSHERKNRNFLSLSS